MCPNFIAELITKSKIMKPYHEIIKKPEKCEGFDKKKYLFNLKRQMIFFPVSKSITINFLLPTLHDPFY